MKLPKSEHLPKRRHEIAQKQVNNKKRYKLHFAKLFFRKPETIGLDELAYLPHLSWTSPMQQVLTAWEGSHGEIVKDTGAFEFDSNCEALWRPRISMEFEH